MPIIHPFLAIHDDDIAAPRCVVVALPCGRERGDAQRPGMFWRYAYVHPTIRATSVFTWMPFEHGRLTRIRHFGVRATLRGDRLIIWPPDRRSIAGHIDGARWDWQSDRIESIPIGNALTSARVVRRPIDFALRAFMAGGA